MTEGAQHIATASKEQSLASEEVARSLEHITSLVEDNTKLSEEAMQASILLTKTAAELQAMVQHFEVKQG